MRVALAGKGGAGKTSISATLARSIARTGVQVVAIDADSNPNLALALGIQREAALSAGYLPHQLVSRKLTGLSMVESVDTVLAQHALPGPDGISVVLMGAPAHASAGCLCSAHATVSALLGDLGERPEIVTVVDMEASPEHLSRGTVQHADVLLLVVESYFRALESGRRLAVLAAELPIPRVAVVANKVRSSEDSAVIREFCERHDMELIAEVPWSDSVTSADVRSVPVIDAPGNEAVVAAVLGLANRILPSLPLVAPRT